MSPSPSPPDGRGAALVIGHGSAGQRHERVLTELGFDVAIVSRRSDVGGFTSIREALAAKAPDYVVVATETMDHARALDELTHLPGNPRILVEKPLFGASEDAPGTEIPELCVGYPLRMHSGLRKLREEIAGQTVISAQIYCGQYLPDWRPDRDHRETYSSDRAKGGGALHDLSHELDYACWLFGDCLELNAIGGTYGDLGISADDSWGILASFERCPIMTLQLNYLFRPLRRDCVVVTRDHSYELDFRANTLVQDGACIDRDPLGKDALTQRLHQSNIEGGDDLPSMAEARRVDALIMRIENAGRGR